MKRVNSITNAVREIKADLPKKARKPYTKRVKVETPITIAFKEMRVELDRKSARLNALEQCLVDKEKEVWTLECEVFDKKAVIKYLEEKLFVLGVK